MVSNRKTDEKYRLSLANHLKGKKFVYLYRKRDRLKVYSEEHLENLFERLSQSYNPFEKRKFELAWARKLTVAKVDKLGRLTIPEKVRSHIGMNDSFEVSEKDKYGCFFLRH